MSKLFDLADKYLQNPTGDKIRSLMDFASLKTLACPNELHITPVRWVAKYDLPAMLNNGDIHVHWERACLQLRKIFKTQVIPGDLRALYYLVATLKPQSVLEVGTGNGMATTVIALALKDHVPDSAFLTLDTKPLNPEAEEAVDATGYENVEFEESHAEIFLTEQGGRYDLVFFNGEQDVRELYIATYTSVRHLNPEGILLYSEYYPDAKPIYDDKRFLSRSSLTLMRLRDENPYLTVLPFGQLPWPARGGSTTSTLALLCHVGIEDN